MSPSSPSIYAAYTAQSLSTANSQSSISTLSTIQQSLISALEHSNQKYDALLSGHNKLMEKFEELDMSIFRLQQSSKKSNIKSEDLTELMTDATHDIKVLKRKMAVIEEKLDDFIERFRKEQRRRLD
ncbi:hypothetical protein FBU30_002927 [Linnemannia zychae]|nr:hypothetical protein FBU30_002927 [Linnemannia zychae]